MGWDTSDRRERLPSDWHTRRQIILRRAHYVCQECKKAKATDVDHINRGDDHSLKNLRALCYNCHKTKTQNEAFEARWKSDPVENEYAPSEYVEPRRSGKKQHHPRSYRQHQPRKM
jgi:5-methylcytosine-specific restriction protein A